MQLTTMLGVKIKVSPNHKNRTFTIRVNGNKYRSNKQTPAEFFNMLTFYTGNDWQQWLRASGDYYSVK